MNKTPLTLLLLFALGACSSVPERPPVTDELVWATEDKRPDWTFIKTEVQKGDEIYFSGMSFYHSTEKQAREVALLNAMAQASEYLGSEVNTQKNTRSGLLGTASAINDEEVSAVVLENLRSKSVIKNARMWNTYTELWAAADGRKFYNHFVQIVVPIKKAYTLIDRK